MALVVPQNEAAREAVSNLLQDHREGLLTLPGKDGGRVLHVPDFLVSEVDSQLNMIVSNEQGSLVLSAAGMEILRMIAQTNPGQLDPAQRTLPPEGMLACSFFCDPNDKESVTEILRQLSATDIRFQPLEVTTLNHSGVGSRNMERVIATLQGDAPSTLKDHLVRAGILQAGAPFMVAESQDQI